MSSFSSVAARPSLIVASSMIGGEFLSGRPRSFSPSCTRRGRSWRNGKRAAAAGSAAASSTNAAADPSEVYAIRDGPGDDGTEIVSTLAWVEARETEGSASGVYACYDASGHMQYVGYSQDVVKAVRAQLDAVGDGLANKVRVAVFKNKAMATRANLRAEADRWIGEWIEANGGDDAAVPVGNQAMYAAQWTLPPETWPDEPTASKPTGTPSTGPDGQVVSPFAAGQGGPAAAAAEEEEEELDPNRELLPLTLENVDAALEEVRPYLIADGGNVEVAGIEDGIVAVRMSGACGSCSSSTATLKGGIEKTLIKVFGKEAIKEVVNLDGSEPGSAQSLTMESVEAHLEKLAGAIHNYGGSVKVLEVTDGVCSLEFSGPVALAQSIASSIKQKFPLVKECKIKQV